MDKIAFLFFSEDKSESEQDRVIITYVEAESRIRKEYTGSWNLVGKIKFDDSRELNAISRDLAEKVGNETQTSIDGPRDCSVIVPRYQRGIIGSVFVQYFLQK